MYYLYIIKSLLYNRIYIGISEDVDGRLIRHNAGEVRSTKAYRPWEVIRREEFADKSSARKRELILKRNHAARKAIVDVK